VVGGGKPPPILLLFFESPRQIELNEPAPAPSPIVLSCIDRPAAIGFRRGEDALEEISAFFKRSGIQIKALTVKDILEEQIARKLV
jgi:hypothetical protein